MLVSLSSGERSVGNRSLNWIDRTGTLTPINANERHYSQPSLSPDGKHIAVVIGEPLRQPGFRQPDSQALPERRAGEGTREHADQGDADLHGGQESAGVGGQSQRTS